MLFFFTGVHTDYHRPSDTWDKLNASGAARVAQLARPWLRLAGDPERIVELLDRVARQWRGIREEV